MCFVFYLYTRRKKRKRIPWMRTKDDEGEGERSMRCGSSLDPWNNADKPSDLYEYWWIFLEPRLERSFLSAETFVFPSVCLSMFSTIFFNKRQDISWLFSLFLTTSILIGLCDANNKPPYIKSSRSLNESYSKVTHPSIFSTACI